MRLAKNLQGFFCCLVIISVAVFMYQGIVWAESMSRAAIIKAAFNSGGSTKYGLSGNGNNGNKGTMAKGIVIKDVGAYNSFIQMRKEGKGKSKSWFINLSKADRAKLMRYFSSNAKPGKLTSVSTSELWAILGKKAPKIPPHMIGNIAR